MVRTRTKTSSGQVYEYAYFRYEIWDEKKGRFQPVPLASLGRTDALDPEKTDSLIAFIRQWIRKGRSLPFEALRERFNAAEPTIRILCSRSFGLRALVEQAWTELGYRDAIAEIAGGGERGTHGSSTSTSTSTSTSKNAARSSSIVHGTTGDVGPQQRRGWDSSFVLVLVLGFSPN